MTISVQHTCKGTKSFQRQRVSEVMGCTDPLNHSNIYQNKTSARLNPTTIKPGSKLKGPVESPIKPSVMYSNISSVFVIFRSERCSAWIVVSKEQLTLTFHHRSRLDPISQHTWPSFNLGYIQPSISISWVRSDSSAHRVQHAHVSPAAASATHAAG